MYNIDLITQILLHVTSLILLINFWWDVPTWGINLQNIPNWMFLIKIKFWFKDVLSMLGKWWGMMKHQEAHKEMLKHQKTCWGMLEKYFKSFFSNAKG